MIREEAQNPPILSTAEAASILNSSSSNWQSLDDDPKAGHLASSQLNTSVSRHIGRHRSLRLLLQHQLLHFRYFGAVVEDDDLFVVFDHDFIDDSR